VSVYATRVGVHSLPAGKQRELAACHRCGIRRDVTSRKRRPPLCRDCMAVVRAMGDEGTWR